MREHETPPPPADSDALGPEADHEAVARKILLDQLTGRSRSRAELATKLARKHVPADVAERLLDRFTEVGLVDDAAFARDWVQQRQAGRGLARRALSDELRRKGVASAVVEEAMEQVEPDDEVEMARALVQRRLPSLQRFDEATQVRRLTGMLARKGYPSSVCFQVVREEIRGAAGLLDGAD